MSTQVKFNNEPEKISNSEILIKNPLINENFKFEPETNLNEDKKLPKPDMVQNVFNFEKDDISKEIGSETRSVLDGEWKEVKIDFRELFQNYSKLSKRNLTGKLKD